MIRTMVALGAALSVCAAPSAAAQHGAAPHWTYEGKEGPSHWSSLDASYQTCRAGILQSPIDVRNAVPADLPAIGFHYQPSSLRLVDNGHTIQVDVPGADTLFLGAEPFELVQFHFHAPSEHTVRGASYPMEMHLVHRSAGGGWR